jgi:HD-GYP domain-containing protein (c-di-GMP phosphodiesterase class II)
MDYLSNGIKTLVASAEAPLEKKMDLLYQNARYLIQKVLSDIPVGKDMERAPQLMDMMADFFAVENITSRFLYSIFSKRYTTFTHSVQVCLLGMAFFNFLGFTKTDSANMGLGSLFHDLGKNFIDPEILDKPGKLTSGEFATVKTHPSLGYEQVKKWGTVRPEALEVILHHHEAMDGNGYPSGLGADQIHPWARIAHIIDCFDALTTDRCYREAVQPFEALRIMGVEMKNSFDKAFLKHFIAFLAL